MRKTLPTLLACLLLVAACDDADTVPSSPALIPSRVGQLTAYPTSLLRSGSSVTVSARVTDASGTNIVGGSVIWSTTAGTLSSATTTTDTAGFASVSLNGRDAATVTAEVAGVTAMTVNVPAIDPFHVSLQLLSTTPTTAQPVGVLVNAPVTREVPNAPVPTSVLVECGNGDQLTPALGALAQCRYSTPGPYVITGTASASGFSTNATAAVTVAEAPDLTPKPVPVVPGLTLTATELHKSTTTATWRFRVAPVGGEIQGNLHWFFDYVNSPATSSPETLEDDDEFEDVTYRANGTKQVSVRGNVSGSEFSASTTIIVVFGP